MFVKGEIQIDCRLRDERYLSCIPDFSVVTHTHISLISLCRGCSQTIKKGQHSVSTYHHCLVLIGSILIKWILTGSLLRAITSYLPLHALAIPCSLLCSNAPRPPHVTPPCPQSLNHSRYLPHSQPCTIPQTGTLIIPSAFSLHLLTSSPPNIVDIPMRVQLLQSLPHPSQTPSSISFYLPFLCQHYLYTKTNRAGFSKDLSLGG